MPPVVQTLITDHSAMIGLVILVFVFITFAMERRPPVVIAVLGGIAMMLLGFLPVSEALGVSDPFSAGSKLGLASISAGVATEVRS